MEEPRKRYILLQGRLGKMLEKSVVARSKQALGLASKSTEERVVRKGELLEALPENEQPGDSRKIALRGIDPKLRLECRKEDVTELTVQEADLLLAISSLTKRLALFDDGKRLDFGKRLEHGSRVLVLVKGVSDKLPGVVRFKGKLSDLPGTMFGVELHHNPGSGTCDGTFRNQQYFKCAPNSAVFVGLDELEPLEDNSELKLDSVIHHLKDENKRLKQEKIKWVKEISEITKERDNLLAQQENDEKQLQKIQHEKDEIVKNLQTYLRAKESQVCELETSLTTAQQALEEPQQLKDENDRLVTSLTTTQQALEDMQKLRNENISLKFEKYKWEIEESGWLKQKESFEKELQDVQHEKDELVVKNDSLQTKITAKEDQVHQLESTLAKTQQLLEEYQQKEACDWIVCRDEVQMMDKCLGKGAWGEVVLGTFRGCKVAVKQIHKLILSHYNRDLFEREMNIASRCRHPCLLQFIGATNDDGSPLFITELLETSLRALLEQHQLADTKMADTEISIISLDVSLALNYLHNMKPTPIIHRDVSSPNVLLWRQGDHWRGKVSDYGTANFVQQTMTIGPGSPVYSAPEAASPNQTSKVDVYSFGVLLCEMYTRKLPDPVRREQRVRRMRNDAFRNLVYECLKADPAERPDMARIIQEFEGCDQTH
ncbi:U-box domain-containing protein 70-like isoform X2 [Acropora millepora]|uniref:U-box domain-containing protein 70-like isoform X2 n=1 Tax=Acropora millepora TaxID=45264 RepID=UPI001CF44739|nr:U-box domain-containing protein 70-like isoform X2 [Acropora millepora]